VQVADSGRGRRVEWSARAAWERARTPGADTPLCQNHCALAPRRQCSALTSMAGEIRALGRYLMSSELIKHITDDSFSTDVLASDKPVLVDYWAEWCGPCKMIAPILDDVSQAYEGRLQITKLNVDQNSEVPRKYGIRGIPTLMLFKGGEVAATKVGALSKAQLTAFLDGHL
jgi:thioredoxin 1